MIKGYLTESNGRWIARLVYTQNGKRRERKRTLGRAHHGPGRPRADAMPRRAALALLADARRELEAELARSRGRQMQRAGVTFRAVALAWLEDAGRTAGRPWKPSTARTYRSILGQSATGADGHIIGPLGSLPLDELTEARMQAWWDSLGRLSPRTANKNLATLRAILAWADRNGSWGRVVDPTRSLRPRAAEPATGAGEPLAQPDTPADGRAPPARRPLLLRPRVRATVVLVVFGVPILVALAGLRILPSILWFEELGQLEVFTHIKGAEVALSVLVGGPAALFLAVNLGIALARAEPHRKRPATDAAAIASLIAGTFFASSAARHWQTFLLWWHRQPFGVKDPMHGKDVGYFVFSLPLELLVSGLLLWLVAVAAVSVALVYRAQGALCVRPLRATYAAQAHLGVLAAAFLLVGAWRLRLEQYTLELGQPSPRDSSSFAGADYVDIHVRSPLLAVASILTVALALCCLGAPHYAQGGNRRRARRLVAVPAVLVTAVAVAGAVAPPLVQRFVVDPSQLVRERPFLQRSITATRSGLGLGAVDVRTYAPNGRLSASEVSHAQYRFANVLIWDKGLLGARARQLVTDTPYYRPGRPTLDIGRVAGRREVTLASARELDLRALPRKVDTWDNDHLAYTHGLGEIRFSGTDIAPTRQPRLLDGGLQLRQPRIYFGELPRGRSGSRGGRDSKLIESLTDGRTAEAPWVVAASRRPEVDIPTSHGARRSAYHYDGTGGIALSNTIRRAAFALELGSKDLLLSKEITSHSRILLHRDVQDRLRTLAPFLHWDTHPATLTANGRIVFVVDGYSTSDAYPYADRVDLGGVNVSYARAPVHATIDAFSGHVDLYLTDRPDPIARAWADAFPRLFRPEGEMPAELRDRLRYPHDLFTTQARAYERFHTTGPDLFASDADVWSRPIALAGPIEVAGNVDFDESDEDDLRLTMRPEYKFASPPGRKRPRLLLETFYSPRRAQNLVASLSGWVDEGGRARLAARALQRDPITLGPAQVSRQVFATPRVSNLLGLRNLEIRDLNKSSLDSVVLGQPHLLFLPDGLVQIQNLFEGSRGPGAARLIGVTAFINGRAGLGPDIDSAVREALNKPPRVTIRRPHGPVSVGKPVVLELVAKNARRAVVTITSAAGTRRAGVALEKGSGTLRWVPTTAGDARVHVQAEGLDGSLVADRTGFSVLSTPPTVRLARARTHAVVGRPLRVVFTVRHSLGEVAEVSTRGGIEFTRRYLIRDGTGVVEWTPTTPGRAVLRIRTRGRQGQSARQAMRFTVAPARRRVAPPTVTLLEAPDVATVGRAHEIVFRSTGCRDAVARIDIDGEKQSAWRFRCGALPIRFVWSPTRPGSYELTVTARARDGTTSQTVTQLMARRPR